MLKSFSQFVLITATTISFFSCQPSHDNSVAPSPSNSTQSTQETACSVTRISASEVRLTCPDGTSEVIKDGSNGLNGTDGINGTNGQDGTAGQDGADGAGLEVIDPCGTESKIGADEVLIRLPDRTIIAFFKFGSYEHLTRLTPGQSYVTTDDTKCEFQIDKEGTILDDRGGKY
jgi:hypothetical protein